MTYLHFNDSSIIMDHFRAVNLNCCNLEFVPIHSTSDSKSKSDWHIISFDTPALAKEAYNQIRTGVGGERQK